MSNNIKEIKPEDAIPNKRYLIRSKKGNWYVAKKCERLKDKFYIPQHYGFKPVSGMSEIYELPEVK